MEGSIPTHHLPASARFPTRVERILPVGDAVNNGVHRHDFHELFFFRSGTGEHMIDLEPPRHGHLPGAQPGRPEPLVRAARLRAVAPQRRDPSHALLIDRGNVPIDDVWKPRPLCHEESLARCIHR